MFAPSLTVVVPAYNERANLPRVVADLLDTLRGAVRELEILVVDDGSTDGSFDGSDGGNGVLPRAPEVRLVRHERNLGLTAALRTGFFRSAKEFVTWVP